MYKTLWISDLDGTLLNREKCLTDTTMQVINQLIKEGLAFSVATARTPETVVSMLDGLAINIPAVVMNGSAVYDVATKCYKNIISINKALVQQVQHILDISGKNAFIYCIENNQLVAYYDTLQTPYEKAFYQERIKHPHKRFRQGKPPADAKVVHVAILGTRDVVEPLLEHFKALEGIATLCAPDLYDASTYYLEVYSKEVSKANAIAYLKQAYAFDTIICFGDNTNDLSMFQAADQSYAVANAVQAVKEAATAVIGHHDEDGVALFIDQVFRNRK